MFEVFFSPFYRIYVYTSSHCTYYLNMLILITENLELEFLLTCFSAFPTKDSDGFHNSLRKQLTFGYATTGFPAKWRVRNEGRNSPWWRVTTQIWVVLLIGRAAYGKFDSTNLCLWNPESKTVLNYLAWGEYCWGVDFDTVDTVPCWIST